ncbi:MAG: Chemotaxis protein cheW [Candidatus Magnetoglobus multicellularis str. Araruama]|uniref:Chemotaxis protein cheW n=1 Tax=Candidatus Magnetoglobus multicellularis str. Araruama TaxID=890399 RepID=A0A1V1PAT0_9BACT|nr:MAG: Chemotaxis protein cheW [Candidatus Magnetoglobus multicellularis str. Araruama]
MKEKKYQFCTFSVGGHLFGVDIHDIREIKDEFSITPVHHAPKEIKGLANIRGQVYLALNLRVILQLRNDNPSVDGRLILFKPKIGQDLFGILVDTHNGVVHVSETSIEYYQYDQSIPSEMNIKRAISVGVCKLQSELLTILNAGNLLFSIQQG